MNLPNYLTVSRIISIPLLMWVLSTNHIGSIHGEKELLASAIFALAAFTDRLDGYLARKYGLITRTGMLLDPLADKLLIVSALIALVQFNPRTVPAWVAIVIIAREFLVTDLRLVAADRGFTIQARSLGKIKMAVQVVAVIAAILDRRWGGVGLNFASLNVALGIGFVARAAIGAMVLLSLISAADYFIAFWSKIDRAAVVPRQSPVVIRRRGSPPATTTVRR